MVVLERPQMPNKTVDLDEFSEWCDQEGLARDGASRSRYASELLRSRNAK